MPRKKGFKSSPPKLALEVQDCPLQRSMAQRIAEFGVGSTTPRWPAQIVTTASRDYRRVGELMEHFGLMTPDQGELLAVLCVLVAFHNHLALSKDIDQDQLGPLKEAIETLGNEAGLWVEDLQLGVFDEE
jgi:hypothetical protein